jgi:hypothetical protein
MTRRLIAAATLGAAALALGACGETRHMAANSKMCFDFTAKQPVATAAPIADGSAPVDNCARRWAYSLAPSRDRADAVAQAVVGACNAELTGWNRQSLGVPGGDGQAASLTTGELTSPIQEHMAFAQSRALLYVVQARAGACKPPPTANGTPDGLT